MRCYQMLLITHSSLLPHSKTDSSSLLDARRKFLAMNLVIRISFSRYWPNTKVRGADYSFASGITLAVWRQRSLRAYAPTPLDR